MEPKEGSRVFAVPEGPSPTEEQLWTALRSRPGEVLSRRELLETMHGKGGGNVQEHAVDATVSRLRRALGPGGACIETVRGKGFRWNPDRVAVDPATGNVWVGGDPVALIPCEAATMSKLASRPGRTFSRAELAGGGGRKGEPPSRAADEIVSSLRRKLGAAGRCIATDRGRGYRFVSDGPEPGREAPAARRAVLALFLVAALAAGWLLRPVAGGLERAEPGAHSGCETEQLFPRPPPPAEAFLSTEGMAAAAGHGPECMIDGNTNTWFQTVGPARKRDLIQVLYRPNVRGRLAVQCGVPGSTNALPSIRVAVQYSDDEQRRLGFVDPATGAFSHDLEKPVYKVFVAVAEDSDEPFAVRSVRIDP